MKKLFLIFVAAMALCACGGKGNSDRDELRNDSLAAALSEGNLAQASQLADSMALYVDDLSPDEVVNVLLAFLEIHNHANGEDLENLRKYIDVYDIALSVNPDGVRAAFARAKQVNPNVDFEKSAEDFRRALAEYDAVQTYGEEPEPEVMPAEAVVDTASAKAGTEAELKASVVPEEED